MQKLRTLVRRLSAPPRLGVALAGGGVRGLAHLPILEAIARERSIDVIAGASAGSLVGALWASGVPAETILERTESFHPFRLWRTSFAEAGLLDPDYFRRHWLELLPETFEELSVPLIVVTTDLQTGEAYMFESGPLRECVLASCALPPIYGPVHMDGRPHVDGGIAMNIPTAPLRERVDVVLASEVNPRNRAAPNCAESTLGLMNRSLELVFKAATEAQHSLADYTLEPPLHEVGMLNLAQAHAAYEAGEAAGAELMLDDGFRDLVGLPPASAIDDAAPTERGEEVREPG